MSVTDMSSVAHPEQRMWYYPAEDLDQCDFIEPDGALPVQHCVSFGSLCFPACFMKSHCLRTAAGPFDYIFSSVSMVRHCIEDGFVTLLDQSQYFKASAVMGKAVGHSLYSSMIEHRVIFNHHDPRLAHDLEHFVRAAERFKLVLASPGRKLFLLVSKQPLSTDELSNLFHTLTRRSTQFELLAIELQVAPNDGVPAAEDEAGAAPSGAAPSSTVVHVEIQSATASVLRVVRQRCRASHTGTAFNDPLDAAWFEELVLSESHVADHCCCTRATASAASSPADSAAVSAAAGSTAACSPADSAAEQSPTWDERASAIAMRADANAATAVRRRRRFALAPDLLPPRPTRQAPEQRHVNSALLRRASKATGCKCWEQQQGLPTRESMCHDVLTATAGLWAPSTQAQALQVITLLLAEAQRRAAAGEAELHAACLVALASSVGGDAAGGIDGVDGVQACENRQVEQRQVGQRLAAGPSQSSLPLPCSWLEKLLATTGADGDLTLRVAMVVEPRTDVWRFVSAGSSAAPPLEYKSAASRVNCPHVLLCTWGGRCML